MTRHKIFSALDTVKFLSPDVTHPTVSETANAIAARDAIPSFMSYDYSFKHLPDLLAGIRKPDQIDELLLSAHPEDRRPSYKEVIEILMQIFAFNGNWYPVKRCSEEVIPGLVLSQIIRGHWVSDGRVYAVLVNPRKTQPLDKTMTAFLLRIVYEVFCREDPNGAIPMIIDLSEPKPGKGRQRSVSIWSPELMRSTEHWEEALSVFLQALAQNNIESISRRGRGNQPRFPWAGRVVSG